MSVGDFQAFDLGGGSYPAGASQKAAKNLPDLVKMLREIDLPEGNYMVAGGMAMFFTDPQPRAPSDFDIYFCDRAELDFVKNKALSSGKFSCVETDKAFNLTHLTKKSVEIDLIKDIQPGPAEHLDKFDFVVCAQGFYFTGWDVWYYKHDDLDICLGDNKVGVRLANLSDINGLMVRLSKYASKKFYIEREDWPAICKHFAAQPSFNSATSSGSVIRSVSSPQPTKMISPQVVGPKYTLTPVPGTISFHSAGYSGILTNDVLPVEEPATVEAATPKDSAPRFPFCNKCARQAIWKSGALACPSCWTIMG